jgi:hypothetical protein
MANVFIVNSTRGGFYVESWSYYHPNEVEAQERFDSLMESVDEDPRIIELVRLDTETLDATSLRFWEGTIDDLDEEEDDD